MKPVERSAIISSRITFPTALQFRSERVSRWILEHRRSLKRSALALQGLQDSSRFSELVERIAQTFEPGAQKFRWTANADPEMPGHLEKSAGNNRRFVLVA